MAVGQVKIDLKLNTDQVFKQLDLIESKVKAYEKDLGKNKAGGNIAKEFIKSIGYVKTALDEIDKGQPVYLQSVADNLKTINKAVEMLNKTPAFYKFENAFDLSTALKGVNDFSREVNTTISELEARKIKVKVKLGINNKEAFRDIDVVTKEILKHYKAESDETGDIKEYESKRKSILKLGQSIRSMLNTAENEGVYLDRLTDKLFKLQKLAFEVKDSGLTGLPAAEFGLSLGNITGYTGKIDELRIKAEAEAVEARKQKIQELHQFEEEALKKEVERHKQVTQEYEKQLNIQKEKTKIDISINEQDILNNLKGIERTFTIAGNFLDEDKFFSGTRIGGRENFLKSVLVEIKKIINDISFGKPVNLEETVTYLNYAKGILVDMDKLTSSGKIPYIDKVGNIDKAVSSLSGLITQIKEFQLIKSFTPEQVNSISYTTEQLETFRTALKNIKAEGNASEIFATNKYVEELGNYLDIATSKTSKLTEKQFALANIKVQESDANSKLSQSLNELAKAREKEQAIANKKKYDAEFDEVLNYPKLMEKLGTPMQSNELVEYFDTLMYAYKDDLQKYQQLQISKVEAERHAAADISEVNKQSVDKIKSDRESYINWWKQALAEQEAIDKEVQQALAEIEKEEQQKQLERQQEVAKREAEIEAEKNRQKQRDREAYINWWKQTMAEQEAIEREVQQILADIDKEEQQKQLERQQAAAKREAEIEAEKNKQKQRSREAYINWWQQTLAEQEALEKEAAKREAEIEAEKNRQKQRDREAYVNWWQQAMAAQEATQLENAKQTARGSTLSISADEISKINNALSQLNSQAKTGTAGEMERMYEYTNKLNEALRILNNTESSVIDKENALRVLRGELNNQTSLLSTTITQQTQAAKKAQILANANSLLTKKTSLLGRVLKQVSGYLLMYLSVYRLVQVIKDAVTMSSDLIEIQNVVDTTFGDSADAINKFAKTAVRDLGMAELSAKKFASSFGATLKAAGIEENLDGLSIALTQLTGDFASFRNISYEDAFQKIQSAITGQTKGIRLYGVAVTDANLSNYALELGINKTTDAMTENEKIMLRMSFMLRAMQDSAGDFVKTQNTWANTTKLLSETWKTFLTVLGDTVRIVFTGALNWIVGFVQNLVIVMKYIRGFFAILSDASTRFDEFGDIIAGKWAAPDYSGFGDGIESEMSAIEESADDASKALNGVLASYDDVQVLSKQTGAGNSSLTAADFNLDQLLAEQQAAMARYQSNIEMPGFDVEKLYSAVEWYNTYVKPIFDWLLNNGDAIKSVIIGILTAFLMFKGLQSIYTGITTIKTGVTGVIGAFKTLGSLFAAGGPVGIVIGVILAIVAALVLLYATSEKFRNSMNEAFKVVGDQAARIWANLQEVFGGLSEIFQDFVNNLNDLGFDIKSIWDFIAEVVGGVIIIIMHILSGFIEFTVKQFGGLFQVFSGLIKFLTGVFTGDWRKAWDGILDIFAGIVKHILAGVDAIIGTINSLLGLELPKLGDLFDDWIESKKFTPKSSTNNSATVTFADKGSSSFGGGGGKFGSTSANDVAYTPYGIDEYTLNSMMNNSANSMKNVLGDMPTEASDYMSSSSGYLDVLTSELKSTNANIGKMNTALAQASRKNINIELDGKIIGQSSVDFINGTTLRTGKTPLVGV